MSTRKFTPLYAAPNAIRFTRASAPEFNFKPSCIPPEVAEAWMRFFEYRQEDALGAYPRFDRILATKAAWLGLFDSIFYPDGELNAALLLSVNPDCDFATSDDSYDFMPDELRRAELADAGRKLIDLILSNPDFIDTLSDGLRAAVNDGIALAHDPSLGYNPDDMTCTPIAIRQVARFYRCIKREKQAEQHANPLTFVVTYRN